MSKRGSQLYIQDINTSISSIYEYTKGMTLKDFVNDNKTVDAVIRNLEIIGQAARNINEEVKINHPEIPWKDMVSLRNKVLHEYFGVDLEILWKTVQEDIPSLKESLSELDNL